MRYAPRTAEIAPEAPTEGMLKPASPRVGRVTYTEPIWVKVAAKPPKK